MTSRVLTVAAIALAGCSGSGGAADGGVDAGAPDAAWTLDPPAPPAPLAAPVMTPCPAGWREVAAPGAPVECDPWPEAGEEACGVDEAHFPGEPGCARVGGACPVGDWAEALPGDRPVVYVRPGASAGGDGSAGAPFATIAEAITAVPDGGVVALAKGSYDEAVQLRGGVALWGACVAETFVASTSASASAATIGVTGAGAELRNLRVGGARPGIWVAGASRSLVVEDVIVAGATRGGVIAGNGARLTATSLVVRDTQPAAGGTFGTGIEVTAGAQLELTRGAVERSRDLGMYAGGATVALTSVVFRDTLGQVSPDGYGFGLEVGAGAEASLTAVAVERNRGVGLFVYDGAVVSVTDVVVRATAGAGPTQQNGRGVTVQDGGEVIATRLLLAENRELGLWAGGVGTRVTLDDVVVRDTLTAGGAAGHGLGVEWGPEVTVRRGHFARNAASGLYVAGLETSLSVADLVVVDTTGSSADGQGRGLAAQEDATLSIARARLLRNRTIALYAGAGATISAEDLVIEDTLPFTTGELGRGVHAQLGARVDLLRAVIERSTDAGVEAVGLGTVVSLTDVAIRDTRSEVLEGLLGRGLEVQDGARVTLARVALDGNRDAGIAAFGAGTSVEGLDVAVRGTHERQCLCEGSSAGRGGIGVIASSGGRVSFAEFEISASALGGAQIVSSAGMDLRDGLVARNPVGVNVQVEGYDLARLTAGVTFVDNGVNLDSQALPVPDPGAPVGP